MAFALRRSTVDALEPRRGAGECERDQQPEQAEHRRFSARATLRQTFRIPPEPSDAQAPAHYGNKQAQHDGKQAGHREDHDHFDRPSAAPAPAPTA